MVQNEVGVMQLFDERKLLSPQGPFRLNDKGRAQLLVIELGVVQQCAEVLGKLQAVSLHYPKEGVVHWFPGLRLRPLRPSTVFFARNEDVDRLTFENAEVATELRRSVQRQVELASEWLHTLNKRAAEPLAHFICEQSIRIGKVGLPAVSFRLPTQPQIGDALACTAVHINRMLNVLKSAELIELHGSYVTIIDWEALQQLGRFSDRYLRL